MIINSERSAQHTLVVHEDLEDGISVEHPPECLVEHDDQGGVFTYPGCEVEMHINFAGMGQFFAHENDHDSDPHCAVPLTPGRYQFVSWSETTSNPMFGLEHEDGLELVNSER